MKTKVVGGRFYLVYSGVSCKFIREYGLNGGGGNELNYFQVTCIAVCQINS